MRKIAVVLAVALMLLVVVGCGGGSAGPADETTTSLAPSGGLVTTSSSDTTAATESGGSGSESTQVFEPSQLLSAEEASAIAGHPITMDDGSLFKDPETGVISERYKYDLGSSTIHALVEIHQDSFKTSDGSVKDVFLFEKDLSKDEITAVDLGDDAFTMGEGQLHMLHDDYYIVVAFDADPYSSDQNAPLNTELGKKILENLKAKLQRERPHALHVRCVGKHVHRGDALEAIAVVLEPGNVRPHRRRIAGDVDDPRRLHLADAGDGFFRQAGPGRVDDHHIGSPDRFG